jgi:hypothetical protein
MPISILLLIAAGIILCLKPWKRFGDLGGSLMTILIFLILPAIIYFHNSENDKTVIHEWMRQANVTDNDVQYFFSDEGINRLGVFEAAVLRDNSNVDDDQLETIAQKRMDKYDREHSKH